MTRIRKVASLCGSQSTSLFLARLGGITVFSELFFLFYIPLNLYPLSGLLKALNRVNVVAVTTILVLHVGVIGHHVPRQSCFMFPRRTITARLRAKRVWDALTLRRGVWGAYSAPREAGRFGGPQAAGPLDRVSMCERMCVCVYVHLCMKVVYFVCLWCLFYLFCGLIRAGESWRLFEVF